MTYVDMLKEKRREVLTDIERLRAEASDIASRVASKEGQLRNLDDLLAIEAGAPPETSVVSVTSVRSSSGKTQRFTDAAVEMLAERGAPVHYQELARLLAAKDIYIPGKDPGSNLIAHMLRDVRFGRAAGRGMYGLAEWPGMKTAKKSPTRRSRAKPASRSRRTAQTRSRRAGSSG